MKCFRAQVLKNTDKLKTSLENIAIGAHYLKNL